MRIDKDEKIKAYTLAMHQLINSMAHVQYLIRKAKAGSVNLMDPEILERLDRITSGQDVEDAMDPINSYVKRKVNER